VGFGGGLSVPAAAAAACFIAAADAAAGVMADDVEAAAGAAVVCFTTVSILGCKDSVTDQGGRFDSAVSRGAALAARIPPARNRPAGGGGRCRSGSIPSRLGECRRRPRGQGRGVRGPVRAPRSVSWAHAFYTHEEGGDKEALDASETVSASLVSLVRLWYSFAGYHGFLS
jgi:hypothetical protein